MHTSCGKKTANLPIALEPTNRRFCWERIFFSRRNNIQSNRGQDWRREAISLGQDEITYSTGNRIWIR